MQKRNAKAQRGEASRKEKRDTLFNQYLLCGFLFPGVFALRVSL